MKTLVALLARHGSVPANEKPIFRGWINEPLDPEGVSQAKDAAKKAKKYPVKHIVTSPLNRAVETAKIYAAVYGCEVEQEGALLPFHTGVFTGLDKEENEEAYQLFMDNPSFAIPNGESVDDIHKRVGDYMEPALEHGEDELTLYVAHSSTGVVIHNLFCKQGEELFPGIDEVVSPGGLVGIYTDGKGYTLEVLIEEAQSAVHGS